MASVWTKNTAEYIEVSDMVPEGWESWFYQLISDSAPFSWGDNNRTLVTASRFLAHIDLLLNDGIDDVMDVSQKDIDRFLKKVEKLGETYIDLEN